jgi:hypothetical protein
MRPAIDRSTVESLILLGKQRGGLTNQDLQAALPVGSMSAEDIALIVMQLEEAGVSVDLDESLSVGGQRPTTPPKRSAEILPFPKSPHGRPKSSPGPVSLETKPRVLAAKRPAHPKARGAHWAVTGSILALLLIAIAMALGI